MNQTEVDDFIRTAILAEAQQDYLQSVGLLNHVCETIREDIGAIHAPLVIANRIRTILLRIDRAMGTSQVSIYTTADVQEIRESLFQSCYHLAIIAFVAGDSVSSPALLFGAGMDWTFGRSDSSYRSIKEVKYALFDSIVVANS